MRGLEVRLNRESISYDEMIAIVNMLPAKREASPEPCNLNLKHPCYQTNPPESMLCEAKHKFYELRPSREDRRRFIYAPKKARPDKRLRTGAIVQDSKSSPTTLPIISLPKQLKFSNLVLRLFRLLKKALSFSFDSPKAKGRSIKSLGIEDIYNSLDRALCRRSHDIIQGYLAIRQLTLTQGQNNSYGQKQIKELMVGNPVLQRVASDFILMVIQCKPEFKVKFFEVAEWDEREADEAMKRNLQYYMGVPLEYQVVSMLQDKSGLPVPFNMPCKDEETKNAESECYEAVDTMEDSTECTSQMLPSMTPASHWWSNEALKMFISGRKLRTLATEDHI
jgi:hypothetical protein